MRIIITILNETMKENRRKRRGEEKHFTIRLLKTSAPL